MNKLTRVLELLASDEILPVKYRNRSLTGALRDFRELHIEPDWLLIYQKRRDVLVLTATGAGTHSDLFDE